MFGKLFGWGKNKEEQKNAGEPFGDWSFIGADIHSHLIPGIDDGAKTMEDSILLLRELEAMGYTKIVTTPHTMVDFYPNTTETILSGLEKVREAIKENDIKLEISAASEYYIDDSFMKLVETQPLLTVHKNEVLVEFSMVYEPPMLNNTLFAMQTNGYKPIIAHPERYMSFHNKFEKFEELKDRGCLLQLNLLSAAGYYGRNVQEVALKILAHGMYDYCGTDMHHEKHAGALKKMLSSRIYHQLSAYPFKNSKLCLG